MIPILLDNLPDILIILAFIIVLGLLYKYNRREEVRKIILSLVVQAEKVLGSGTGELKYAYVLNKYYECLPIIIRFLYTPKEIDAFITEAVAKLKSLLAKGVSLSGYDDEIYIKTLNK